MKKVSDLCNPLHRSIDDAARAKEREPYVW